MRDKQKSNPTKPTPIPKPFVKRIVDDGPWISPYDTGMTSKDWDTAMKDLESMLAKGQIGK